jgi:hypothetical protein
MLLSQLLNRPFEVDPVITGVTADSRKVRPGFLFAALPGSQVDGRSFIPGAIAAGAAAILAPEDVEGLPIPAAHAGDLRRAYALAAAQFWGRPAGDLRGGDRHQRQDLGGRLLPPDLRPAGSQGGQHGHPGRGGQRARRRRPAADPARPDHPRRRRRRRDDGPPGRRWASPTWPWRPRRTASTSAGWTGCA